MTLITCLAVGFYLPLIVGFLWLSSRQQEAHQRVIADLCQRIQAPDLATHEHHAIVRDAVAREDEQEQAELHVIYSPDGAPVA